MAKKKASSTTLVGKKRSSTSTSQPNKDQQEQAYQSTLKKIRKSLAKFNRADVKGRYEIGQHIHTIRSDPEKYGKQLVKRLAVDLEIDESTLYAYASVAEVWSADELKKLQADSGEPLSWSHLVELAKMTDKKSRNKLIKETQADGLSVRQMKAKRAARSTSKSSESADVNGDPEPRSAEGTEQETASPNGSDSEKTRQVGIRNAKAAVEAYVSQLSRFQELHKVTPDNKDNGGGQLSQEQKQGLQNLRDAIVEGEKSSKSTRACIDRLLENTTEPGVEEKPAKAPATKPSRRKGQK